METTAILEILCNYDFSFFWLTKRAILKFQIRVTTTGNTLLYEVTEGMSHKTHFGRIFDHKISIFGRDAPITSAGSDSAPINA